MEKPDLYSLLKQFNAIGGMAEIGQPGFCLLMALWQKANELNWVHQFTMTNTELLYRSGYNSEGAMINKRNQLKQYGYLDYIPPKKSRSCGTYILNFNLVESRFSENAQSENDSVNDYFKQSHLGAITKNNYAKRSHFEAIDANDFTKQSHSGAIMEPSLSHSGVITETLINQTKPNQKDKDLYPEEFETFWKEYPRTNRQSKSGTYKKWTAQLKKGATVQKMIAGAQGYAAWCRDNKKEEQYIKSPETFLGPESHFANFLDYATEENQQQSDQPEAPFVRQKTAAEIALEEEREQLRLAEERRKNGYLPPFMRQRDGRGGDR